MKTKNQGENISTANSTKLSSKPEPTIEGFTKAEFINYLCNTLIPDLEDSGMVETARDFKTCVGFMGGAK